MNERSQRPAFIAAMVCSSFSRWAIALAIRSSASSGAKASRPSWSPTTMSPGTNGHAAEGDGDVDRARAVLVGPAVGVAAGVDREGPLADLGDVADRAVQHHAGHADRGGVEGQDAADERVGAVAVGVHDHHVAGAAELEGAQDREVVAGAGADGDRGAGERRGLVIGPQPGEAAVAVQLVADQRDLQAAQALQQPGGDGGGARVLLDGHGRAPQRRSATAAAMRETPSSRVSSDVAIDRRK